jgi:hypothetical protein
VGDADSLPGYAGQTGDPLILSIAVKNRDTQNEKTLIRQVTDQGNLFHLKK